MSEVNRIHKLVDLSPTHIGSNVKLHGWVYSTRSQGAGTLVFIDLGDGTTVTPIRCIAERPSEDANANVNTYDLASTSLLKDASSDEAEYNKLSFDELGQASRLSVGCSVLVHGAVVAPPEGTTQTFEVKMLELFLIGGVEDPSKYPIQKSILKKPLALRSQYHSRFRAPLIQQIMLIRSQALFAVHEFFSQRGSAPTRSMHYDLVRL